MQAECYEFIGTAILILIGNGVVANVALQKTFGHNSGWIVICFGWAMAVYVGVFISAPVSGGHLNPAVTVALAFLGKFSWSKVVGYLVAQAAGAFTGSVLVWLTYKKQYDASEDAAAIKASFCTAPAVRSPLWNMCTEIIGTFVLIFAVLSMVAPASKLGALEALPVALLVLAIGLGLGGATGYAINPVRDFGPRIAHFLLPIKHKGSSDWGYFLIPIIGPFLGSALAAMAYHFLHLP
ncbi:MAG TPA: MIP/aquaporin family protein [Phnomibacter sp.]|nr:MIP/aquaporin family protein [Phnomibacter sp.]